MTCALWSGGALPPPYALSMSVLMYEDWTHSGW
jgi:hypothetical protein